METDISKVLRSTISSGKVLIGTKQTLNAVKNGKAQIVVVSSNCPEKTLCEMKGVPVVKYPGSTVDLGVACGKPFSIAAIAVIEPGESEILSFGSMNE
ncbi:MAG: 50S ribosomal protein L30e [Candidatus Methanoperedens sp.]|nr:50S ribosomal protein L30e [Candidatus Methanoperedens sp.]MCE8424572.1 50S ribosomal protein L30e [Candidatus Methanoperedens sp.]MCE8427772.1 50S ribosomal protein L30e [Candidatus Methanoperedens sp.]